jgi:hypothetical protein
MIGPEPKTCRCCGWALRPGAEFCRACDAAYTAAMRKAKTYGQRAKRFPLEPQVRFVDGPDKEIPF